MLKFRLERAQARKPKPPRRAVAEHREEAVPAQRPSPAEEAFVLAMGWIATLPVAAGAVYFGILEERIYMPAWGAASLAGARGTHYVGAEAIAVGLSTLGFAVAINGLLFWRRVPATRGFGNFLVGVGVAAWILCGLSLLVL